MNELQIFNFKDNEVRTQIIDEDIWFCLKDVCDILELTQPSKVKERLNEKGVHSIPTLTNGGTQSLIYVNESNLYKVIFQSRKEEAEEFTEYVTGTILPSIRKHGAYMTEQTLEQALTSPDFLIRLATELKEEQQKRKELEIKNSQLTVENQILIPKGEYFDEIVDRNLLTNIRTTAKELHVKEKDFTKFLVEKKYCYRDKKNKLQPYANYKADGLFEIKECFDNKTNWKGSQMLITPKGRETFRLLLK